MSILIALLFLAPPDTLIQKIRELIKNNNIEKAETLTHQYLQENKNKEAYLLISRLFKNFGYREKGLSILKEGRRVLKDESLFAHEFYIDAISKRDFKTGLKEALNLLAQGKNISWVEREIIRIKKFLGLDATVKEIKRWQKKHKKVEGVKEILASLYISEDRLKDAVEIIGKKGDSKSLEKLALMALKENKPDIALDALNKIKEKERGSSWFFLFGKTMELVGNLEEAVRYYEIAWKSGYEDAKTPLFEILLVPLNDPERVLSLVKIPDEWYIRALLKLGKFDEAESLCMYISENEEIAYLCAELTLLQGNILAADSLFREMLVKYGRGNRVNDALLWLYLINNYGGETDFLFLLKMERFYIQGKYTEVEDKIKKILKSKGGSPLIPYFVYLLASTLEKERKYDEAFSLLIEAGNTGENFIGAKSYLKAHQIAKNELKNEELSRDILRKLLLQYPDSPYADVARTYLESP